jgi:hypothetical protein
MLPRFLIADNSLERPGKLYVVHTQNPRFILEGSDEDFTQEQKLHWIDNVDISDEDIADLIADAEDFVDQELDNQEDLFDNMVN